MSLSEGSFSLEFKMTVFANSLHVNFPGDKGVDCMAPRGPCLPFNDGIITKRTECILPNVQWGKQ